MIKILVLFEISGGVSVPFREAGFDVTTIDILPHKVDNEHHIKCDIWDIDKLGLKFEDYTFLIAFPPCTYFSKAGLHYMHKQPLRKYKQARDLELIKMLWSLPIKYKCFENPEGSALKKLWQKPNCKIDYKEYTTDFAKATCLWLQNLPPLLPAFQNWKKYGSFITNMGHDKYKKSKTPIEVGYAMVNQWGAIIRGGVIVIRLTRNDYKHWVKTTGFYNKKDALELTKIEHRLGEFEDILEEFGIDSIKELREILRGKKL